MSPHGKIYFGMFLSMLNYVGFYHGCIIIIMLSLDL